MKTIKMKTIKTTENIQKLIIEELHKITEEQTNIKITPTEKATYSNNYTDMYDVIIGNNTYKMSINKTGKVSSIRIAGDGVYKSDKILSINKSKMLEFINNAIK